MAIYAWVTRVEWDGDDLIIHAEDDDGRAVKLRSVEATVAPYEGDFLHFGCAGARQPDGSYFGGGGFIKESRNGHPEITYPYRRISHDQIIQDW